MICARSLPTNGTIALSGTDAMAVSLSAAKDGVSTFFTKQASASSTSSQPYVATTAVVAAGETTW